MRQKKDRKSERQVRMIEREKDKKEIMKDWLRRMKGRKTWMN